MSGSEGKQNSQLSSRDIEAEEMAQELMNMEMYEEGMDYETMKEILRFINESKNMAGIEPENRVSQEVPLYSEEITAAEVMAKDNSQRESIPEENSIPKPSFSYLQQSGRASPSTSAGKSSLEIVPVEEMSLPPSPDMFDNEDPKRFVRESETIFNKLVKENETITDKDEINENRSQTLSKNNWPTLSDSSQNSQNSYHSGMTNIDNAKSRKNQRVERWKLDPTNVVVEENDVPLKESNRPLLNERVPYSFCHNKRVFEASIGDKVLTSLTHALEEVADIWRRKHRPDVSDFQWGSPIKVGANNGSLDKKPVIEEADSPKRSGSESFKINPDSVQRRNMDRNCKRKAAEYIRDISRDQIESDDETEDLFEVPKKSKKSDRHWQPKNKLVLDNSDKSLTRQEKIFNNLQNSNKSKPSSLIDDYDSEDFDNDDLNSLRKKNIKKDEEIASNTPVSPVLFRRRIIPPNPSRPRGPGRPRKNGEKGKQKSPVRKNAQAVLEKSKNSGTTSGRGRMRNPFAKQTTKSSVTLNDDEISNELEKDMPEENEVDIEIKPLPVRGLVNKLQYGISRLLETKKVVERLEKAKEQETLKAEMDAKLLKNDIVMSRYLKEKEEQKEKETKELANKEKEENWKKTEAARERDRRRRQMQEKKRSEDANKSLSLMDDDDDDDVDTLIGTIDAKQSSLNDRVQCPICLLEFTQGEIQDHAADCNQFDNPDEPGTSRSPANNDELIITNEDALLDCNLCGQFTTANGIVYEQHVNDCAKRRTDDSPAKELVVEVPNSPIRCFLPISKQTESTIKYAEQFPGQKVKPNTTRTKRRR